MVQLPESKGPSSVIMIMGATGTGKSTFINLLTADDKIRIGHNQQSETFGIQTAQYIDETTGRTVVLIDTPGFDDSREGVTDTVLLEKIARFLEPGSGERLKINGIIYMHRISDPRVSGTSRKNIKMFHLLCGEDLHNVRVVTTNWSRVGEEEGDYREADLQQGAFKALISARAQMRRHNDTLDSARQILSELIPLDPTTMKIQEELGNGKKLVDTAAGMFLAAEMLEVKKKHEREMADLKSEMEDAEQKNDRALRAELEVERKTLEEKMERTNTDRKRLESTLVRIRHTDEHGTHEEMGEKKRKDAELIEGLGARNAGTTNKEPQSTRKILNRSQSKDRDSECMSEGLNMIVRDKADPIQQLTMELAREHKTHLQQMEASVAARQLENKEAERHMRRMESDLQRLEDGIEVAERKKRETGNLRKAAACLQSIATVTYRVASSMVPHHDMA